MYWERMSIDEYAEYERGNGTPIVKAGDVWWRAVRPLFFRPLLPFQEVDRESSNSIPLFALGNQHAVANTEQANSYLNVIVFDDVYDYALESLKHKKRNKILKALNCLTVRVIDEQSMFCEMAISIYKAFYERTHYYWKRERLSNQGFEKWAMNVFKNRKVVVHGVFYDKKMVAINISYLVEDILIDAAFFSTSDGLAYGSSEATWHVIRDGAAKTTGVRYIYEGPVLGIKGVDESKLIRGCKIVSLPAYLSMNRFILQGIKLLSNESYQKMIGLKYRAV
jgi:hypothetical protein